MKFITPKGVFYNILIVGMVILIGILLYFISVNTFLSEYVLANSRVGTSSTSLLSQSTLKEISENFQDKMELKSLIIKIKDNEDVRIPLSEIELSTDAVALANFGRGADITKVLSESIDVLTQKPIPPEYQFNKALFLSKLPFNFDSPDPSIAYEDTILCNPGEYEFELNFEQLNQSINQALNNNLPLIFNIEELYTKSEDSLLFYACEGYKTKLEIIQGEFQELNLEVNLQNLISLTNIENPQIRVKDQSYLNDIINNIYSKTFQQVNEGEYEIFNNQIYLYRNYSIGRELDKESSFNYLADWIKNPVDELSLLFKNINPRILNLGLPIIDFTKSVSTGQTRLELIRNNQPNYSIPYSVAGLEEIHNVVVQPGEEFSYINTIQPTNGNTLTKSGRIIGSGICNATTTLFRAVLEGGFKISERNYHTYSVESYAWGYPLNLVDAAYYTDPNVDFKFVNDTNYPIMIKTQYTKDTEFQYNTVTILTSVKAPTKTIRLNGWKIWDQFSKTNYKGSFDREIYENGILIKTDNFYSHYL